MNQVVSIMVVQVGSFGPVDDTEPPMLLRKVHLVTGQPQHLRSLIILTLILRTWIRI